MIKCDYSPLERILAERGISKGQLAKGATLSKATLAKIGNNEPLSLETLGRIAFYLNEPFGNLLDLDPGTETERKLATALSKPENRAFRIEFETRLVASLAYLSDSKWSPSRIRTFLTDGRRTDDSQATPLFIGIAKVIRKIVANANETFDVRFVNEIIELLVADKATFVSKELRRALGKLTFEWTGCASMSPEAQAQFAFACISSLVGFQQKELISYALLVKSCLLYDSFPPLLNEELSSYYHDGLTSYQAEPTYLVAAIEAGIEETKRLLREHLVQLI